MSLKADIQFAENLAAAGFKLNNSKAISAQDGPCWHATLVRGTQKLITVSNGGYGGPDETHYEVARGNTIDAIKASLDVFAALPRVQAIVHNHYIALAGFDRDAKVCTETEYEAKKAEILSKPATVNEEALEIVVGRMADIHETLKKIKRKLNTHVCWVSAGKDEIGEYYSVKAKDSPQIREILRGREEPIDYFIADLIVGL